MNAAPDLSQAPPRNARQRVGLYVILGRMIDKACASFAGVPGNYLTNCPLDHLLLDWKGIAWPPFWAEVVAGSTDEDFVRFFNENGREKTVAEVAAWSSRMEAYRPFDHPAEREWFVRMCRPLDLDPRTTTLFDGLDILDRRIFGS